MDFERRPGESRRVDPRRGEAWARCAFRRRAFVAWLTLLAAGASPARAQIAEVYGLGARATAMGGAFTAIADDWSAVYYNPAGLQAQWPAPYYLNHNGFRTDAGFLGAVTDFHVEGLEGPLKLPNLGSNPGGKTDPGNTTGFTFGVTFDPFDIGGLLPARFLALGFGLFIPAENAYRWNAMLPEEVHWIFYEDYGQRILFYPSIAFRILDNLFVGVGGNLLFDLHTDIFGPIEVPLSDIDPQTREIVVTGKHVLFGTNFSFDFTLSPVLGLLYRPSKWLSLGASFRGQQFVDDAGLTDPILEPEIGETSLPGVEFNFHHLFAEFFTPNEATAAIALCPSPSWLLSADVTWMDWSQFIDRVRAPHRFPQKRFRDTFVPRLGASYEVADGIRLLGGYFYYRSPAPEQTGATNDLDADRHVFSLGGEALVGPARVDLFFQYHWLVERTYSKESPDLTYFPSYSFGGAIYNAGVNVSVPF